MSDDTPQSYDETAESPCHTLAACASRLPGLPTASGHYWVKLRTLTRTQHWDVIRVYWNDGALCFDSPWGLARIDDRTNAYVQNILFYYGPLQPPQEVR